MNLIEHTLNCYLTLSDILDRHCCLVALKKQMRTFYENKKGNLENKTRCDQNKCKIQGLTMKQICHLMSEYSR